MSWLAIKSLAVIFGTLALGYAVHGMLGRQGRLRHRLKGACQFAIRALPVKRIGRVVGMVVPVGRPLVAPLTGRACVYYRVEVSHRGLWGTNVDLVETAIVPFAIDDGTGAALVDVTKPEILVGNDLDEVRTGLPSMSSAQFALLEKHGVSTRGLVLDKNMRFVEQIIEVGERIAAVGRGVPDTAPTGVTAAQDPYRQTAYEPAPAKIRLTGRVALSDLTFSPLDDA